MVKMLPRPRLQMRIRTEKKKQNFILLNRQEEKKEWNKTNNSLAGIPAPIWMKKTYMKESKHTHTHFAYWSIEHNEHKTRLIAIFFFIVTNHCIKWIYKSVQLMRMIFTLFEWEKKKTEFILKIPKWMSWFGWTA